MAAPAHAPRSHGVRAITLDAGGVTLSALLSEPERAAPAQAVVVALHGGGMNAGYFDGQAHPRLSLMTLGASLGHTVLAVDRPGYGRSAADVPEGQGLAEQAASLGAALRDFADRYGTGAGMFVLAHSYGGKVALTAAAEDSVPDLLGLDISGCGHAYAVEQHELPGTDGTRRSRRSWGELRLYPPDTFFAGAALVEPMPPREYAEILGWPAVFEATAHRVRVPVRLTFAEHEAWWRHDDDTLADLVSHFRAAPRVVVDRLPDAGHNISLGWAARSYHLRALAFLEGCLVPRETARPAPRPAVT
ncbi:alpha/beta hydrolase [Streptomyces sp. NBC_00102]|uniref:alpha/beta hydrolase n=1 Tax=Streptomyces sp. NBC_00102 TaxID=2975652 RepID=UPI0022527795|nr:alpha/beta hydrolase [Streptomyces sp. NBC_00102]MCX5402049.1 alpha/beta hydrolase [Streptomyces sp. NBC_00102]